MARLKADIDEQKSSHSLGIDKLQITFNNKTIQEEYPSTESIKYIGSKLKLIPHILKLARNVGTQSVSD